MAVCPKCGRKLKITDLKPECPGCGVNLLYYKIEERLEVDAINAELEHAKTQKRIDRVKAATVGSTLSIVRLVLLVLVVGTLFLPLASLHMVGPYFDNSITFNALELYNKVSAMDFDGLLAMLGSPILGKSVIFLAVSIVTIVITALSALLGLILSILSSSKKGFARNVILAGIGIVTTIVSIVFYNLFITNVTPVFSGLVDGGVGFGAYIVIVAFLLVIAINVVIKVKGAEVKYKQSYVDGIPYETFAETFGDKKYEFKDLVAIQNNLNKLKEEYAEKTA